MREKLETLSLVQLRELAKAQGLRVTGRRKSELVDLLCEAAEKQPENRPKEAAEAEAAAEPAPRARRIAGTRGRRMAATAAVEPTRQQAASDASAEAMVSAADTAAETAMEADAGGANTTVQETASGRADIPAQSSASAQSAVVQPFAAGADGFAAQETVQPAAAVAEEQTHNTYAGRQPRSQMRPHLPNEGQASFAEEGQPQQRTPRGYVPQQRRVQGAGTQGSNRQIGPVQRRQTYQPAEGEPRQAMQRRTYSYNSNPNQENRKPVQRRPENGYGKPVPRQPQQRPTDYRVEETTSSYEEETAENDMPLDMRTGRPVVSLSIGEQSPEIAALDSGKEANGILEVMAEGFGFIRCENFLPGENDVYVAPSQIRRFNLKTGDIIRGNRRIKTASERFAALLYITSVNGYPVAEAEKRPAFENLTPIFPNERIRLENGDKAPLPLRVMDLLAPIGKGQRGMIVSPPKAGKTTLLKQVAKSVIRDKDMHLIILLIDERPEEVTDIREEVVGENVEVIYSTFDELPERHKRVSEMVIERAKRLVEYGKDVTILLDSITRLARAYNLVVPPSGRTLSGGLDPAALHMPKRFFGAARNMREGGSLTILATALIETGSRMDDVIYEEFKGTGNMELVLDRKLSEKRIFPAIDILKSGTRRDDLLLSRDELEAVANIRKGFSTLKPEEAVEKVLDLFAHTRNNRDFVAMAGKLKFY